MRHEEITRSHAPVPVPGKRRSYNSVPLNRCLKKTPIVEINSLVRLIKPEAITLFTAYNEKESYREQYSIGEYLIINDLLPYFSITYRHNKLYITSVFFLDGRRAIFGFYREKEAVKMCLITYSEKLGKWHYVTDFTRTDTNEIILGRFSEKRSNILPGIIQDQLAKIPSEEKERETIEDLVIHVIRYHNYCKNRQGSLQSGKTKSTNKQTGKNTHFPWT